MALDFPSTPTDGQQYEEFYWDATAGIWRRQTAVTNIDDLNDVAATSPDDEDILIYNSVSGDWESGNVSTIVPEPEPPLSSVFLLMGA
jgi:hypothetical protein